MRRLSRFALLLLGLAPTRAVLAQVVTDGTLGPATTLTGPDVIVPSTLGQTRGTNLFHSFTRLDIPLGESVTFQGPGAIHNVLARVTGGTPSNINGLLRCDIPGADLYLINPAGVVIGPAGSLEVRGSFAVTSASSIRLGTDGRFDARVPANSVLTTSAPAAFGFAGAGATPPGEILVRGNLGVGSGKSISVVGGSVRIVGGELLGASGTINVASVATPAGEATLNDTGRGPVVRLETGASGGAVELSNDGLIDATGDTPGLVTIRGGSLRMGDAMILSNTTGATPAAVRENAIDVELTGPLNIDPGAAIFALANSAGGTGGDVRIAAIGDVTLDGGNRPGTNGVATRTSGTGAAGSIHLTTDAALRIIDGGDLGSTSEGAGRGGDINVQASELDITGGGQLFAQARAAGDGGNVSIDVVGPAQIDGPGSGVITATARNTTGRGGDIDLTSNSLSVSNQAFVSATTNGSGDAGNIRITADTVTLDGKGSDAFTGVGANTQPDPGITPGAGGSVFITAGTLNILDGAGVAARAFGGTDGGRVDVDVRGELLIDASRTHVQTGLTAQASGSANGGSITARAQNIELRSGQITASAAADGGEIQLLAPDHVRLTLSEISAEAGGNGGNISIDNPQAVILDRSRITANAVQGNGGNIAIRAQTFIPSADPETAVTASSQFGLVGNVVISAPDTEIAGALVRLSGDLASPNASLQALCGASLTGDISSFVATGRGGSPPLPGGWQPALVPIQASRKSTTH